MLLNGPQFDPNGYNGSLKHPHYPQTKQQEQPFYSYGLDSFEKQNSSLPSFDGMNQTLAPGALDNKQDQLGIVKSPRADSLVSPFDTTFNDSYDSAFDSHGTFNRHFAMDSLPPSGQNTPGASEWSSFLNDSSWADEINWIYHNSIEKVHLGIEASIHLNRRDTIDLDLDHDQDRGKIHDMCISCPISWSWHYWTKIGLRQEAYYVKRYG